MIMRARAGTLQRRIMLLEPVDRNVRGTLVRDWKPVGPIWARIRPISSREYVLSDQVEAERTHDIEIRVRRDVQANWRIQYQGRIFEILGPPRNLDENNERMVLSAKETTGRDNAQS